MKPKKLLTHLLTTFIFVAPGLVGCKSNDTAVKTYHETKPAAEKPSMDMGMAMDKQMPVAPPPKTALNWQAPVGWQESKGSGMRLASFTIPNEQKDGNPGDASIIALAGTGGSLSGNVNRWRGQLGLEPIPPQTVAEAAKTHQVKGETFKWFRLENQASPAQAIYAAIMPKDGKTIFVKMTGPKTLVAQNESKFLKLCESVQ